MEKDEKEIINSELKRDNNPDEEFIDPEVEGIVYLGIKDFMWSE